jgi:hypothetical protein
MTVPQSSLGGRLGILTTVLITDSGTAAAITALLLLPMIAAFALTPVIGIARTAPWVTLSSRRRRRLSYVLTKKLKHLD